VLPAGVVCDKCNNGVLSTLDKVLIEFDPIAMLRVHNAIPTKAAKWPKAQFGDGSMQRLTSGHVHVNVAKNLPQ
jgi:hypothetical protein